MWNNHARRKSPKYKMDLPLLSSQGGPTSTNMRICSPDAYNEKKNPFSGSYFIAVMIGIAFFFIMLFATKGFIWFVKIVLSHWLYIGCGFIFLLFLKKFLGRKHMVVHQAVPSY